MTKDIKKLRIQFLKATLDEAAFTGWNDEMLANVEHKLHLQPNYHMMLFSNGIKDVVTSFEVQLDTHMEISCDNEFKEHSLRVRDKVRDAIMVRLKGYHENNKLLLSKLSAFYRKPAHVALSISNAWSTVDKIWYAAGDEATDFNYYTKRGLLFPVYKAALKYYITDNSKDASATKAFIEKRIDEVMQLAKVKSALATLKSKIPFLRLVKTR